MYQILFFYLSGVFITYSTNLYYVSSTVLSTGDKQVFFFLPLRLNSTGGCTINQERYFVRGSNVCYENHNAR